jgi:hypothetical protein
LNNTFSAAPANASSISAFLAFSAVRKAEANYCGKSLGLNRVKETFSIGVIPARQAGQVCLKLLMQILQYEFLYNN